MNVPSTFNFRPASKLGPLNDERLKYHHHLGTNIPNTFNFRPASKLGPLYDERVHQLDKAWSALLSSGDEHPQRHPSTSRQRQRLVLYMTNSFISAVVIRRRTSSNAVLHFQAGANTQSFIKARTSSQKSNVQFL
ncbi:unnamed protein product [Cuscuta europaea]|uniref:Uncharacterized protein n=1 Tax=Cuscuta europaea TaxID=41803 RepID=A0A9P1EI66_CUSEU|nr:unnamed protein product [Cuscuta europaea]